MNILIVLSTTLITLALVFYSTGVWFERYSRYLKGWHVVAFWLIWLLPYIGGIIMGMSN